MTEARRAIADFKRELARIYGGRLQQVILYGSHARGDATEDSDIDLLVVLSGPVSVMAEIDRMAEAAYDVDLRHGVLLSVFPVSDEDFRKRMDPLLMNVRREGVAA